MSAEPVDSAADDAMAAGLVGTLLGGQRNDGTGFVGRLGNRIATAQLAYMTGRSVYQQVQKYRTAQRYQVSLYEQDELYGPVQAWVLAHMPPGAQRALVARSKQRPSVASRDVFDDPAPTAADLELYFDGDRQQAVRVGGHQITVTVEKKDWTSGSSDQRAYKPAKITFGARTSEGRDAVVAWLRKLRAELSDQPRQPRLYIAAKWGDWHCTKSMGPRPADSVILAEGLLDDLVTDVQKFHGLRDEYRAVGQPWHRGFLFHGPPGTGKTSTAQALASALQMDVFYLPLSDMEMDTDLNRLLGAVGSNSMLLLEDIDVAAAATERSDQNKGVSLSGLLNALDGVITPDGLVTVMTTNDRSALDPALLREGRSDREIHFGYLTDSQFNRLAQRLVGGTWSIEGLGPDQITPARVVEVVKPHLGDKRAAFEAMYDWTARQCTEAGTFEVTAV
jgi:hypothetical protein